VGKTSKELEAEGHDPQRIARLESGEGAVSPPAVFDNLSDLRSTYEESLTEYRNKRTWVLNTLIMLSFFGGLALALLVTMLVLLKIVWGSRLWLPTIVATVCCIVVCAVSTDPSRVKSVDGVAVAFTPYFVPPPATKPPSVSTSKPAEGDRAVAEPARPVFVVREYDQSSAAKPGTGDETGETLAWHPLLIAGADGRASIDFQLPASPGAFRVRAEAHGDGRIGAGDIVIRSSQATK
jgi:hypothetical protein